MATLLFVVAAATSHSPVQNTFWYECRDAGRASCVSHVMPKHRGQRAFGFWQARRATKYVVYPYWKRQVRKVKPMVRQVARAVTGKTETWLITWYEATGHPMANGIMPSVGWAACGYDVALGTRITVSGLGSYVCGDREGYMPFHHADLFNVPLGTGYREVVIG